MLVIMGDTEGVKTALAWRSCQLSPEKKKKTLNHYGISLNYTMLMTRATGVQRNR